MKKIILTGLLCLSLCAQARDVISLNQGWDFRRGDREAQPVKVNLPHDFLISQPWVEPDSSERADLNNGVANTKSRLSARGFKEMGTGWYSRLLALDPEWKGKRLVLDFEGIMLVGDVWFNGKQIASTDYGYLGMDADITELVDWDGDNVIEVFADTRQPNNSRWYTGGGLYRDVNLIITDPKLHFERHPLSITTHDISDNSARIAIQAEIASPTTI